MPTIKLPPRGDRPPTRLEDLCVQAYRRYLSSGRREDFMVFQRLELRVWQEQRANFRASIADGEA